MDINDLRSLFTVLAFIAFIGIVWWAYSDRRKKTYDEAAMLPLDDDSPFVPQVPENQERKSS
ncbi:MAG: cbb3-type cytochrome c oxidase subunit 3 [Sulfuritalea sp.]|uniref:cbb3-type cytochrome oxidase subunit 3 n=1 Tax=Sulfuritalea sp. TaxID=2480090 RepID=UPI002747D53F|nr:cbb3-type cytochrome c oxidase subunit 3 [Sulfuritalea sp.]MDP1735174.1 cbb3-type cytochrome c oxidase subunit 3 [Sulfuritalea sp.]MDZ4254762.1 cbb3-type cytochrome c oxidase subunit 3 [Sulfuritalea sp.]